MEKQLRIGQIKSLEDVEKVLRDVELVVGQLTDLSAVLSEDPPATPRAIVRLADGTYEAWDIVSGGGCTVTKEAANKRILISVP